MYTYVYINLLLRTLTHDARSCVDPSERPSALLIYSYYIRISNVCYACVSSFFADVLCARRVKNDQRKIQLDSTHNMVHNKRTRIHVRTDLQQVLVRCVRAGSVRTLFPTCDITYEA